MEVYEFDKCLLDRLEESMNVLCWKDAIIPASQVRQEWAYFIELQIEPAGWQALWNIPRVICNELDIRYPTIVFGYVEQVLFKELKCIFIVEAVQDENVQIPERHEVSLEDLWPTKKQENTALNVERTADCIDRLRFFYTNVWMPWDNDNDDDLNWVQKHLESRIRLCYDLRKRTMKRSLAAHIRHLLDEARLLQQRREYLELDLSDDEDLKEKDNLHDTSLKNKSHITDLMRVHLRLAMIRSEVELFENPELRHIYEQIHFDEEKHLKDSSYDYINAEKKPAKHYIVVQPAALQQQLEVMQRVKEEMKCEDDVQFCQNLQNAFNLCAASDTIFLSPGIHTLNFLQYLNDNGRICGIINKNELSDYTSDQRKLSSKHDVMVHSADQETIMLVFDGDYRLDYLSLDCRAVRTGLLVKNGHLIVRNCRILGDGKTSTQVAISCARGATITLENCIVENFATGISVNAGSKCFLKDTKFLKCDMAINFSVEDSELKLQGKSSIIKCKTGIFVNGLTLESELKQVVLNEAEDLNVFVESKPNWHLDCIFKNNKVNFWIKNEAKSIIKNNTIQRIAGEDFLDDLHADLHAEKEECTLANDENA